MTFAGINYWAVLVAGAVGFAFGGVWYRLLAEPGRRRTASPPNKSAPITARARRPGRSSSRSPPT